LANGRSSCREYLLGDLQEGFAQRAAASPGAAVRWYWAQALASLPYLALDRARSPGARRAVALAAASLAALLLITLWDMYVARGAARLVAAQQPSYPVIRIAYFLVYLLGGAAAGAIIAAVAFRGDRRFPTNAAIALMPIVILLAAILLARSIGADRAGIQPYLILRTALTIPALLTGAWLWWRRRDAPVRRR